MWLIIEPMGKVINYWIKIRTLRSMNGPVETISKDSGTEIIIAIININFY